MLTPTFWKKYFEVYDTLNELIPYQELLDRICLEAQVKKGDKVLDVGSGTGNLASRLEVKGAIVTGIDYSEEGMKRHKGKISGAELFLHDITQRLPFPDGCFDAVVSNNVLYAIAREKRPSVFRELYRVLKPAGRIVVSNIIEGFSPSAIYFGHIHFYRKKHGWLKTFEKVLLLLLPTVKIFYYNILISREHAQGTYDFFEFSEQKAILQKTGFKEVSDDQFVYCGQAILNSGVK